MAGEFDLLVLGAGSGGYACALRAAQLGLRVGLVERDVVGGTCLHRGCIPTKAILHAAEVADAARSGAQFGVHATIDKIDLAAVTAYAESVVGRLYKGLSRLVQSRGIEVIAGSGRLVPTDGPPAVQVGESIYTAPYVVLATGSAPRSLAGLTVDGEHILTSDHAWRLDRLLAAEEPAISTALERAFRKRGITLVTSAPLESATVESGGVSLSLAGGRTVTAEVMLVAVGRGPVSEGLGYAEAGVGLDRGFVTVDHRLRTAVSGVYAVGDLVAGLQLAHRGFAHGLFVAEDIAHRQGRTDTAPVPVVDRHIPRVTYCDPEVASVGLTEEAAPPPPRGGGAPANSPPRHRKTAH